MCVLAAGDVSIWDFSGVESYYVTYDRFLGDPNAIYIVVVSSKDSAIERRKQIDFWLNVIASRMIPVEPIGKYFPLSQPFNIDQKVKDLLQENKTTRRLVTVKLT